MIDSAASEEFVGRFGITYKDGETIYAYDEISHGLYSFKLDQGEVNLLIPSVYTCRNMSDKLGGISKSRNEIILIPFSLASEWIFYNTENGEIHYEKLFEGEESISGTVTIDETLVLVPLNIYNPIIMISLKNMKEINFYHNWLHKNELEDGADNIWGASFYRDIIIFPIVNSKRIVYINDKKINMITIRIPFPILSVSMHEEKLWVLPVSGEHIYKANLKGEILDKIRLSKKGMEISADDFVRIIATGGGIYLLPAYGKVIYIYQYKENRIVQIKEEGTRLPGGLFVQSHTPYWDFVIENNTLHFFPSTFRYKRINLLSLECNEDRLQYGNNIDDNIYWNMVANAQKNRMFYENEKRKAGLEELFELVQYSFKDYSVKGGAKIGKQIWESIG